MLAGYSVSVATHLPSAPQFEVSIVPRAERRDPDFYRAIEAWALRALDEEPARAADLIARLAEASAGNEKYRSDGAVRLSPRQMNLVLGRLRRRGVIKSGGDADLWVPSARGHRELARLERLKQSAATDKDAAADLLVSMLDPTHAPKTALDVGTGGGFMACKLAEAGFDVLGVDRWDSANALGSLREARAEVSKRGLSVRFQRANMTSLRRRDAFDYVVASNSFHEMQEPLTAIRASYRLLKPGGMFACLDFTVGAPGLHSLLALTAAEWRRELHAAGFPRVRIHDLGMRIIVLARKPE